MNRVRQEFWEKPLHDFLLQRANDPFIWGSWDCCLFAADAIKSFMDFDIADDFRRKYKTRIGALKAIKSVTGGSAVEDAVAYCAKKYGLTEHTHILMAKRGDLVVFNNGDDVLAGIVHLSGRHVISVSETGLVRLPITAIRRAWSV